MNDEQLRMLDAAMLRLADGDRSASGPVFSLLWPEVLAFAARTLGHGADADDVAQQALEKLFAQASDYDASRSTLAWALAIAAWECRTVVQRRRRKREVNLPGDNAWHDTAPSPEAATIGQSLNRALQESLAGLSQSDRITLEKAYFLENEGPTSATFRKRKERALERLRSAWRRIYGD